MDSLATGRGGFHAFMNQDKIKRLRILAMRLNQKLQKDNPPYKTGLKDCRSGFYHGYKNHFGFQQNQKVEAFEYGFTSGYEDGFENAILFLIDTMSHKITEGDIDDLEGLVEGLYWRFTDNHPYSRQSRRGL